MAFVYDNNFYAPAYGGTAGKDILRVRQTGNYTPAPLRLGTATRGVRNGVGPAGLTLDQVRSLYGEAERGSYHLEVRNEVVRFGPITAATISGTTVTVTVATGHNIQTGEAITIRQVNGATELNANWGPQTTVTNRASIPTIRRISDTQFSIAGVASITAFTTSANSIVEVPRPFYALALSGFNTSTNVFTTSTAHNLAPGDQIVISQVTGLTGATWLNRVTPPVVVATTPSTTTFTITAPGTSTGTASGGVVIPVRTMNNLGLLRVLCDRAIALAAVSSATPAVYTSSVAHGLRIGDRVFVSGVAGTAVTALNTGAAVVRTAPSSTTFTLETEAGAPIDGAGSTATANTGLVWAGDVEYTGSTLEATYLINIDLGASNPSAGLYSGPFNA